MAVKGIFKDSVCDFSVDLHYDFGSGDGEMLNRLKKKKILKRELAGLYY